MVLCIMISGQNLSVYKCFRSMFDLQYMPKFFSTAARTSLVDCVHGAGLVHSQKCALANQRCVHLLLRVRLYRWL